MYNYRYEYEVQNGSLGIGVTVDFISIKVTFEDRVKKINWLQNLRQTCCMSLK